MTRAAPADRGRVVDTVVTAFEADPAFRFFFPDHDSYREQAAAFTGHLFDRRVPHGTVWIVGGGVAVAMWDGPSGAGAAAPDAAPALALPAGTMSRLEAYDAAVHAALPVVPHWYLGVVATRPDHAGRRLGRAVMAAGLREAAAAGLPAYLETTNPGNVTLYQRAGWEVETSMTVQAVQVWVMKQLPSGPATR